VPVIIPEINPEHAAIIETQRRRLGTVRGFITAKPNCSIQSYVPALAALREFSPEQVFVSTYQAISGAGKTFRDWPEMVDNLIPYIGGEEEKSEQEPLKIWGAIQQDQIMKAQVRSFPHNAIVSPFRKGIRLPFPSVSSGNRTGHDHSALDGIFRPAPAGKAALGAAAFSDLSGSRQSTAASARPGHRPGYGYCHRPPAGGSDLRLQIRLPVA
jgi:hypothetical protein